MYTEESRLGEYELHRTYWRWTDQTSVSKWIAEEERSWILKSQNLLSVTKNRKLWRGKIVNVLKGRDMSKKNITYEPLKRFLFLVYQWRFPIRFTNRLQSNNTLKGKYKPLYETGLLFQSSAQIDFESRYLPL